MKLSCLLTILHFVCMKSEPTEVPVGDVVYELIYGTQAGEIVRPHPDSPGDFLTVKKFDNSRVTSVTRHNDTLFVSLDSGVQRCEFRWNWVKPWIFCEEYSKTPGTNDLTFSKDNLFLAQEDGDLLGCPFEGKCRVWHRAVRWLALEHPGLLQSSDRSRIKTTLEVTGVDHEEDKVYVMASSKTHEVVLLWSCLVEEAHNCTLVYKYDEDYLTAVHVAYDSVWLGGNNLRVLRCPIQKFNRKGYKNNCHLYYVRYGGEDWEESLQLRTLGIDSWGGYLYLLVDEGGKKKVYRCDPRFHGSCRHAFDAPDNARTFMFVV